MVINQKRHRSRIGIQVGIAHLTGNLLTMHTRRIVIGIATGLAVLLILLAVVLIPTGTHRCSVIVTKQTANSSSITISAIATNQGSATLMYHGMPAFSDIRVHTSAGWTNVPQDYLSGSASFGFVRPGRAHAYHFSVPSDTDRFQITCYFTSVGPRGRAAAWLLDTGLWNKLSPVSGWVTRFLPYGSQEYLEFFTREIAL